MKMIKSFTDAVWTFTFVCVAGFALVGVTSAWTGTCTTLTVRVTS